VPLLLFLFFLSASAQAKVSANVPSDFSYYALLDRLEAYGCARPTFRALRPQGQADLRAALALAEGKDTCEAPAWLLREREVLLRQAQEARVGLYLRHEDPLPLSGIDATVEPTYPDRQGRFDYYGANLYGEMSASAEAGQNVGIAASVTPGFVAALEDYNKPLGRAYLHEGFLKLGYGRWEATYGRTALGFGNTAHGGLLLGPAAKPLNLWKFAFRPDYASDTLSAFSAETWIANNDPKAGIEDSKIWGVSVGARPFPFVEITLLQLYQFGGVGAPGMETRDYLEMLAYGNDPALQSKRQRSSGIDLGVWIPGNFVKAYGQLMFDASDELSYLGGIWFPRLGFLEARIEYVSTAATAYRHPFWTQGLTYQGTTLGHSLGPDADGIYFDFGFPVDDQSRLALGGWYERRGLSVVTEKRAGAGANWIGRWVQTEVSLGVRFFHVENALYLSGQQDNAASALLAIRYSFL